MYSFCMVIFIPPEGEISSWSNMGFLYKYAKKANVSVEILFFELSNVKQAIVEVSKREFDAIGVSILQNNLTQSIEFINSIKVFNKNTYIIVGNIEPTVNYEYFMEQYQNIDCICVGEGEYTLYELLKILSTNGNKKDCLGIIYRENGIIIKNKCRPLEKDLDKLGIPDRSYLKNIATERHTIMGSRGCEGHCAFCDANTLYRNNECEKEPRMRSIQSIIDEIDDLRKNYRCNFISFSDSSFCYGNSTFGRLEELLCKLRENNI